MNADALASLYRDYIACLNRRDLDDLKTYVHDDVRHNGQRLGVEGYRLMLQKDFTDIPDLRFDIELLVCQPPLVASRLRFDCTPKANFLGLAVDGVKVSFSENVFYEFQDAKIITVWSVIDKTAIEVQLRQAGAAGHP
ncbi:putative ester cyclase [Variovorax sp. SG517]|uniref:ester cyclase n=1 Tax=Variovorax sp. SG517 TaxID=2587117 RepID=UPI00159E26FC|nr:ester cyclase [Variovorax sp. SG517]NVM90198.1 putative ester cyclase [Variovorax sp. SG517]